MGQRSQKGAKEGHKRGHCSQSPQGVLQTLENGLWAMLAPVVHAHGAYPHLLCVAWVCLKKWEQSQHLAFGSGLARKRSLLVAIWILFKTVTDGKGHECACNHAGHFTKG